MSQDFKQFLGILVGVITAVLSTIQSDAARWALLAIAVISASYVGHLAWGSGQRTALTAIVAIGIAVTLAFYERKVDSTKQAAVSLTVAPIPETTKTSIGPAVEPPDKTPNPTGAKQDSLRKRNPSAASSNRAPTRASSVSKAECPGGVCQSAAGIVSNPTVNNASPTVNCPNGICQSDGTMNNPTVNNYGPPPAEIHYKKVSGPIERDRPVSSDEERRLILSGKIPTPKDFVSEFEVTVMGQNVPRLIIQSPGGEEVRISIFNRATGMVTQRAYQGPEHNATGRIDQAFDAYEVSVASYFGYPVDLRFGCPGSQCIIVP